MNSAEELAEALKKGIEEELRKKDNVIERLINIITHQRKLIEDLKEQIQKFLDTHSIH